MANVAENSSATGCESRKMQEPPPQSFHSVGNEKDDDKDNGAIVLSPILQNSDKFIRQNWPGAPGKFL